MFRVVKSGRYVILHAICHVSLNVRIKRGKKRITLRAWAACALGRCRMLKFRLLKKNRPGYAYLQVQLDVFHSYQEDHKLPSYRNRNLFQ